MTTRKDPITILMADDDDDDYAESTPPKRTRGKAQSTRGRVTSRTRRTISDDDEEPF